MKFGLEAEKFIFDNRRGIPSESVFSLLNALSDYELSNNNITNEFVLNMVEFGTTPSESPSEVLKEYLFNYRMIQNVASREQVSLVPLGALPMDFIPHMTPKLSYYVQNSILSGAKRPDWMMELDSPLRSAGNCAGVHVHAEVETRPEFLFSNHELQNKFNMGLMMTPMIGFSSSPYFFLSHEARSMRGLRYYEGVYKKFPLNGGMPPVMDSSGQVLEFMMHGQEHWLLKGEKLGFTHSEMQSLICAKGANWGPVRWNGNWNTIEIRCIDSDTPELDGAKFIWMCAAMKRMDIKGENLQCHVLDPTRKLDAGLVAECFKLSGNEVSILSTHQLREMFHRAIMGGTKDELVEAYLHELGDFAKGGLKEEDSLLFNRLLEVLDNHQTTGEILLSKMKHQTSITETQARSLVDEAIAAPDDFAITEVLSGEKPHV